MKKFVVKKELVDMSKKEVSIKDKYLLTVEECALYFNIGINKIRRLIAEDRKASYLLYNGTKVLIKRKQFEKMLDEIDTI